MHVKLVLLTLAVLSIVFVHADFYFNRPQPKPEEVHELGLECIPGRTVIKVKERTKVVDLEESSSEDDYRRTHMNFGAKDDELCEICVCSSEGKDEYCSKRPAMNVNECIVMARINEEFNKNIPFDVDRLLANRIRRRDLIYHNDEIPYDVTAKCYRGISYYSNDPNANNTDLDVGSDIESLLDYDTHDLCFYCVCSTNGLHSECISRDPFYCEYFRFLKNETDKGKTRYGKLFKQDRPAYFRQISYRIRRTMDEGMFQLVDNFKSRQSRTGGDSLCCGHPAGHRRNLHNQVRDKILQLRRRVPKENLMSGGPSGPDYVDFIVNNDKVIKEKLRESIKLIFETTRQNTQKRLLWTTFNVNFSYIIKKKITLLRFGDNFDTQYFEGGGEQQCVPYVSKYSTCTDENSCAGCKECTCDEQGQWACEDVTKCFGMDSRDLDENSIDMAWEAIEETFKKNNRENSAKHGSPHVPRPHSIDGSTDDLLGDVEKEKFVGSDVEPLEASNIQEFINMQMDSIKDKLNSRFKRSVANKNNTNDEHTIKFYHTVDEVNEDTLKHSNDSGMITAKKAVANFPVTISRRSEHINGNNTSNPLHIEYKSKLYDHNNIADNKIDSHQVNEKSDAVHDKLHELMKNKTKDMKDKDLSKVIVNELRKGIEVIGDKNSPSISNITFVPENDTLTAMAFIAGNLLNKLWNIEKDDQGESMESEVLKHEKIADLVDLFKEPLTIRQESFLKDALEHLASVMTKGSDDKHSIPLCDQVKKIKANLGVSENCSFHHDIPEVEVDKKGKNEVHISKALRTEITNDAAIAAVKKLDNVMSLLQKYEDVQKKMYNVQTPSPTQEIKNDVPTSRSTDNRKDQLTDSESQSLNLYGNVLGKITKLLVPKKKHKNLINTIRTQNIFKNDEDLKSKLKRIYDIDLDNSTFTSKDKVVLDYLVNLRNKKCKITDNSYDDSMANGDIVQNLSEFLKVKSFVDLLKMLEPEKTTTTESTSNKLIFRSNKIQSTEVPVTSTIAVTTVRTTTTNPNSFKDNLSQTKEKLKGHLKAIISDLLELQKATGVNTKDGNIKIAEALPCLYNILSNNKIIEDKTKYQINKIKSVFDSIKEELKFNPGTRRANMITEARPKSAAIWERVIKNAELNTKTRRQLEYVHPTSFDEVNLLMHSMDGFHNNYKNTAISIGVAPHKRLTLLKTIDVDARIYIGILEKVKLYLEHTTSLSPKIGKYVNDFLNKAVLNLKLDEDVLNNIYKHKGNKKTKEEKVPKTRYYQKYQQAKNSEVLKVPSNAMTKTVKLSRDEIINQLIKNRVQFYLKVKELEGDDKDDDLNVRLARRILNYLESRNYTIARELFKVFVAQKQQNKTEAKTLPRPMKAVKPMPRGIMALKEPLIQFEEEKGPNMGSDMMSLTKALMKQLSNIKNMRS